MPRFLLSGDLLQAVRVEVEASSREEAIEKARAGKFTVYDTFDRSFSFDGDVDEHIEEIEKIDA